MKYQAKNGFVKRTIAGEILLVPVGGTTQTFNGMVMLNETASCIWDLLQEPKSEEELVSCLLKEFDADQGVIASDVKEFLDYGIRNALLIRQ